MMTAGQHSIIPDSGVAATDPGSRSEGTAGQHSIIPENGAAATDPGRNKTA